MSTLNEVMVEMCGAVERSQEALDADDGSMSDDIKEVSAGSPLGPNRSADMLLGVGG